MRHGGEERDVGQQRRDGRACYESSAGSISRGVDGGTAVAWNDPRVNMLYADPTGLPPIMIYCGAHEILAGEAVEFAERAKDAGVDVNLHALPEGQHNFIWGAGRVPEADQAIEEIGRWLRSKLGLAVLAAAA